MDQMEDRHQALEDRVDELEDSRRVAREFMLDKLASFDVRLEALERKACEEDDDEEPTIPTPKKPRRGVFQPPEDIEELNDYWQDKLKNFFTGLDSKESLTSVQVAYLNYWLSEQSKSEPFFCVRKRTAEALLEDGIKAKMWVPRWRPVGIKSDLPTYLYEKLRGIVRRERNVAAKKQLDEDFHAKRCEKV